MKNKVLVYAGLATLAGLLAGCVSEPPGVEKGPHGTVAYYVSIDASAPGARVEANGEYVGNTPLTLKIFGDKDGTFHDFGSYYYGIRALPLVTNQYPQVKVFRTGRNFSPEDHIPKSIYFDMTQPQPQPQMQPQYPASVPPGYPVYGPPYYYGYYGAPYYYYPPPYYYGPAFRFYVGPPHFHHW